MNKKSFLQTSCMMAAFAAFGLCLTACSDDDDNDDKGGGSTSGLPTMNDLGITHQVTGIKYNDGGVSTFNYVDGRLTSGHTDIDNMDFTIGGSPLTVWCGVEESDGEKYEETYTNIKTNSHGAMTYADVTWREEGYGEVFEGTSTMTIEYDGNRMTRLATSEAETYAGEAYTYENVFELTWDGDNVNRIKWYYYEGSWEDPSEKEPSDEGTIVFEYGDDPETNSGINPPYLLVDLDFMSYAGLFGRTTSHIAQSYTYEYGTYEITVSKDSEGRIKDFFENGYLYESYLYDGETPTASAPAKTMKAAKADKKRGLMRKIAEKVIARRMARR